MINKLLWAVMCCAMLTVVGCSSKSKSVHLTGFLPDTIILNPSSLDKNTLEYIAQSFQPTNIDAIYVAPVNTSYLDKDPTEAIDAIAQRMTITLQQSLTAFIEVIPEPSPGIPELHTAITTVSASAPLLNIHPATKITGLGLGGASIESMLIEPQTQQVLYAIAFSRQAAKRVGSGLTKWDDAHAVVQAWATDLASMFQPDTKAEQ